MLKIQYKMDQQEQTLYTKTIVSTD